MLEMGYNVHIIHAFIGLQALYDKYKDRGLVILGFPCNQVNTIRGTSYHRSDVILPSSSVVKNL